MKLQIFRPASSSPELTAKSMRGEIDFLSHKERVKLLKGLTITDLDECFKVGLKLARVQKPS